MEVQTVTVDRIPAAPPLNLRLSTQHVRVAHETKPELRLTLKPDVLTLVRTDRLYYRLYNLTNG
jgi:hypothetical protein